MQLKQISLILLLASPLAPSAKADNPPPPPPNPFSNLPAAGSENVTPFDDDFDDGSGAMDDTNTHAPKTFNATGNGGNSGGFPPDSSSPAGRAIGLPGRASPSVGGGRSGFIGGGESRQNGGKIAAPASCKEVVENFDYPDAEILDVAKAIGKLAGKNFIYNPQDIKGRISLQSQTQITVCDAWNAFLTALNIKGFAIIPSGKFLRIERLASAREKQTPIYSEKKAPSNDEFITRVIPLRYIDATEFESSFRLWIPREARMQAYGQTNTLILTDTAAHISRMMELIGLLDVAGYQESLVVMPIHNAAAKDVAKLIENILNSNAANSSSNNARFGYPPRPGGNNFSQPAARTGTRGRSGGSTISKIIADDRTNSLIVKANAAGMQEVRALVRRLDTKIAASEGSGKIHVVTLRFANAEDMAKTITGLSGAGGGGNRNGAPRAFPVFGEVQPTFQTDFKVSADKTTQSLVITASPQDFNTLKKVIERLDQPRDQVFIEAVILEMAMNRDNSFGVSFLNTVNGVSLPSASGNLTKMMTNVPPSGFVLGFKNGMSREVEIGGVKGTVNSFQGMLELIQGNTDSNVIATPQILALDNEKATFEVSETVPVPTVSVTSTGLQQQSFTNDTASLKLEVTPQINKGSNYVKLDIIQQLENFDPAGVPAEYAGKAVGKNKRATTTKVFVQSDDTVVLSGMIRNSVSETVNKVPLLGDIPVLGWLFKNSKKTNRKSNLLVFITPKIIKQYDKIRKIVNEKLDEREEFVRETLGSIDPNAKDVYRIKKSLPDLTVIEPLPQAKPMETSSFQGPASPDRSNDDDDDGGPYERDYFDPNSGPYPLQPFDQPPPGVFENYPEGAPAPVVPNNFDNNPNYGNP